MPARVRTGNAQHLPILDNGTAGHLHPLDCQCIGDGLITHRMHWTFRTDERTDFSENACLCLAGTDGGADDHLTQRNTAAGPTQIFAADSTADGRFMTTELCGDLFQRERNQTVATTEKAILYG